MKEFLEKFYATPYGRLVRRFVIVGLAAVIPYFLSLSGLDPRTIVDKVMAIPGVEWIMMLKLFIGAGLVAGLDKLKREWTNLFNSEIGEEDNEHSEK